LAVGSAVRGFTPGDRVITYPTPTIAREGGDDAFPSLDRAYDSLGQGEDGTLLSYGVFAEHALVCAPSSLGWAQAASLSCTFLTAWNALSCLPLDKNQSLQDQSNTWVLVLGTGGVSIAALQLASAAGFSVVATTSSPEKEARLRELGAKHTINYRAHSEDWGQLARSLTPASQGFDLVVDIGGNPTLAHSISAVRVNGTVAMVANDAPVDGMEEVPMTAAFSHTCTVRGLFAGTRQQLDEVVHFVEKKGVRPVVDDRGFELADAKRAYRYLEQGEHFAKVIVSIDHSLDVQNS